LVSQGNESLRSGGGIGGRESGEEQEKECDALESLLAPGGIEPLANRMGSAAGASGTEGDCLQAERERDVGVSGGTLELRWDSEVGIDGAYRREQR